MKVEVLTKWESLGLFDLNELPTKLCEHIIIGDGEFNFVGIGRNCNTGMTELYVEKGCGPIGPDYHTGNYATRKAPLITSV